MALFSPLLLLVSIFVFFAWQPALGTYTVPTAMNTAHAVLFALSTLMALMTKIDDA
jgi:hypothetical protein